MVSSSVSYSLNLPVCWEVTFSVYLLLRGLKEKSSFSFEEFLCLWLDESVFLRSGGWGGFGGV